MEAVAARGAGRQQARLDHARGGRARPSAVMPALCARSDAVWARPSISSDGMEARAWPPIRAAISERAFTVVRAGVI